MDSSCISPYPTQLEEALQWAGQAILLRPIRPEDEDQHAEFLASLDPEMISYSRSRGTLRLVGSVLPENQAMLKLARDSGFELDEPQDGALAGDPRDITLVL